MMVGSKLFKILFCLFFLLYPKQAIVAHSYEGHNNELASLLFGDYKLTRTARGNTNFDLLCRAARLAIDFTSQSFGSLDIDYLEKNGVENLPSVYEISYPSNQYHQRYTHKGWDFTYPNDVAKWQKRKKILVSTVEKIGSFKKNERIKIEAFAGLVYEIHILGDHIGDSEQTRFDRLSLASTNSFVRDPSPTAEPRFDSQSDLYSYLLYHIQRLFREQSSSGIYQTFIQILKNNRTFFFDRNEHEITIEDVKEFAIKTRNDLMLFLPMLLKNEAFFRRAFYE